MLPRWLKEELLDKLKYTDEVVVAATKERLLAALEAGDEQLLRLVEEGLDWMEGADTGVSLRRFLRSRKYHVKSRVSFVVTPQLLAKHGFIEVRGTGPGATVLLDGEPLDPLVYAKLYDRLGLQEVLVKATGLDLLAPGHGGVVSVFSDEVRVRVEDNLQLGASWRRGVFRYFLATHGSLGDISYSATVFLDEPAKPQLEKARARVPVIRGIAEDAIHTCLRALLSVSARLPGEQVGGGPSGYFVASLDGSAASVNGHVTTTLRAGMLETTITVSTWSNTYRRVPTYEVMVYSSLRSRYKPPETLETVFEELRARLAPSTAVEGAYLHAFPVGVKAYATGTGTPTMPGMLLKTLTTWHREAARLSVGRIREPPLKWLAERLVNMSGTRAEFAAACLGVLEKALGSRSSVVDVAVALAHPERPEVYRAYAEPEEWLTWALVSRTLKPSSQGLTLRGVPVEQILGPTHRLLEPVLKRYATAIATLRKTRTGEEKLTIRTTT